MAYFLTVFSGPDEGKSCEVVGECVIGRAGDAGLQVEDESVSWEHAIVREIDDRLVIENLSALGTTVNGKAVTGEVRLSHGDEVALSPRCSLRVESRLTAGARRTSPLLIIAAIVVIGIVGIMAVVWVASQAADRIPARRSNAPTAAQWRAAYGKLDRRLAEWEESHRIPEYLLHSFREAWRFDQGGADEDLARDQWSLLYSELVTHAVPNSAGTLFGTIQTEDPDALMALMGRGQDPSLPMWNTDESYAQALLWFIKGRLVVIGPEK